MRKMRRKIMTRKIIESETLLVMKNLSSISVINMGNYESMMVSMLATAISGTVEKLNSYQDGMEYISKTLGFTCIISIDREDTIIPDILFKGLTSFNSLNKQWIKLINETNYSRPINELVYHMSKSCLLSFTEIIKILEATIFKIFEYKQPINKYYTKTKQSIILSTLDQLGLVHLEYFYNEKYR
jgi:hypothetical protein